jgi:hypothetical protein
MRAKAELETVNANDLPKIGPHRSARATETIAAA